MKYLIKYRRKNDPEPKTHKVSDKNEAYMLYNKWCQSPTIVSCVLYIKNKYGVWVKRASNKV